MIVIGEKINATRKVIAQALADRDADLIVKTAVEQVSAGANYIDANGGDPNPQKEVDNIAWLMGLIQSNTEAAVAVDSANPDAMRKGLSLATRRPILNSISLESDRLEKMMPLVTEFDCMVVALLMSDSGTPCQVEDRLHNAEQLVGKLLKAGKKQEDIIVDPCFLPVSTDPINGRYVIDAISLIHQTWPQIHIGGGCSNISFGLPKRKLVNFALLSQAIYHGMDAGLIDPCIPGIMSTIYAAEAVAGKDDFCMNYVMAEREGRLI